MWARTSATSAWSPILLDGFGRWAGRSSVIAGLAGAAANTLLLACLALLLIRPDLSQEKLGSLAALPGGRSCFSDPTASTWS